MLRFCLVHEISEGKERKTVTKALFFFCLVNKEKSEKNRKEKKIWYEIS